MRNLLPGIALSLLVTPLTAQSIVGSWFLPRSKEAQSHVVITFLSNGTYVLGEDGDPKLDPSGQDGMERGTYKWNSKTKAISFKTLVDTNGQWGMSHAEFETAAVTKTKLTITDESGPFSLTRVTGKSPIIGSWYMKEGSGYCVLSFLADGTYYVTQDGKKASGGKSGVERGTYQWNSKTKAFTFKVTTDTNGTWGLSDAKKAKITVTIAKNRMTLKVAGDGSATFSRVIP
ncbi:MAG: hypothetical protein EOP85_23590 [Verrucomicrobiaceae bacterium]|nr:MAG: hypothetical protein EOP85_23590 [Verrucomicrobiaceae bacterium]